VCLITGSVSCQYRLEDPTRSDGRSQEGAPFSLHAVNDVCTRCGRLMVVEHYMDLQDDTDQIDIIALWCTSCGEAVNHVILENHSGRPRISYPAGNSTTTPSVWIKLNRMVHPTRTVKVAGRAEAAELAPIPRGSSGKEIRTCSSL